MGMVSHHFALSQRHRPSRITKPREDFEVDEAIMTDPIDSALFWMQRATRGTSRYVISVDQRERNGALFRVHAVVGAKVLDNADIVREACFRQ